MLFTPPAILFRLPSAYYPVQPLYFLLISPQESLPGGSLLDPQYLGQILLLHASTEPCSFPSTPVATHKANRKCAFLYGLTGLGLNSKPDPETWTPVLSSQPKHTKKVVDVFPILLPYGIYIFLHTPLPQAITF